MKTELNKLSPLARRDFIMRTAQTALGVTVMPALNLPHHLKASEWCQF